MEVFFSLAADREVAGLRRKINNGPRNGNNSSSNNNARNQHGSSLPINDQLPSPPRGQTFGPRRGLAPNANTALPTTNAENSSSVLRRQRRPRNAASEQVNAGTRLQQDNAQQARRPPPQGNGQTNNANQAQNRRITRGPRNNSANPSNSHPNADSGRPARRNNPNPRRLNQNNQTSNSGGNASSNNDPPISKRAAKRRRAKERKAEVARQQQSAQNVVVQSQPARTVTASANQAATPTQPQNNAQNHSSRGQTTTRVVETIPVVRFGSIPSTSAAHQSPTSLLASVAAREPSGPPPVVVSSRPAYPSSSNSSGNGWRSLASRIPASAGPLNNEPNARPSQQGATTTADANRAPTLLNRLQNDSLTHGRRNDMTTRTTGAASGWRSRVGTLNSTAPQTSTFRQTRVTPQEPPNSQQSRLPPAPSSSTLTSLPTRPHSAWSVTPNRSDPPSRGRDLGASSLAVPDFIVVPDSSDDEPTPRWSASRPRVLAANVSVRGRGLGVSSLAVPDFIVVPDSSDDDERTLRWSTSRPRVLATSVSVPAARSGPSRRTVSICSICLDSSDEFPSRPPTTRCAHTPTVCAPCLEEHISHAILSSGFTAISCPEDGCRQTMEYFEVKTGARKNRCFERVPHVMLDRSMKAVPTLRLSLAESAVPNLALRTTYHGTLDLLARNILLGARLLMRRRIVQAKNVLAVLQRRARTLAVDAGSKKQRAAII
ncbi:hypothetical protein FRC09_011692 [Ceratobasidium sp. 395]|nr:hypothetical protein FRC09_011692 [Ceratobasidium sp. 395]